VVVVGAGWGLFWVERRRRRRMMMMMMSGERRASRLWGAAEAARVKVMSLFMVYFRMEGEEETEIDLLLCTQTRRVVLCEGGMSRARTPANPRPPAFSRHHRSMD
jgi:hypothetical protein